MRVPALGRGGCKSSRCRVLRRGRVLLAHPATDGGPDRAHLSKYRKLIPALALIFALVDTPDSGNVIHERELIRALAWGDYLRSHAERLYAAAVIPETTGAQALLTKIKAGKLCDGDGVLLDSFEPWKVAVKHWAGLTTPDAVRKAADMLTDYGWLAREAIPAGAKGGRPSNRYLINPMLLKGGE
jgi:putative DNA primase/helicase